MTPTIQAIAVPVLLNLSYMQPMTLDNTTSVSLVMKGYEHRPTAVFNAQQSNSTTRALEWLEFAKSALPNALPLTAEERGSINTFFWSQFK
jgi:hypothetical protein